MHPLHVALRTIIALVVCGSLAAPTAAAQQNAPPTVLWPSLILQDQVTQSCRQSLAAGKQKRQAIDTRDKLAAWQTSTLATIRSVIPKAAFHRAPLNARVVSQYDLPEYRIENVLFQSLPGWEVNGTVYLPRKPGRYPGVVCPTGHSNKGGKSYQQSAQVFARNGFIAISFDPPGAGGEMAHLNDHFTNGLIGYLTGFWSQTHFVVDALAAIDYLQTRPDVDPDAGFAVTGVSGGGHTSMYVGLLDDRVKFVAPVCCLAEHESLHLTGLYTSCPEQFGPGYVAAGLDYADLIAALAPKACLVVGGKEDEVFDYRATTRLFDDIRRIYRIAGVEDRCGFFLDEQSGHGYTVAMANEVVRWMNRILKNTDRPPLPLADADVPTIEREKLLCHPTSAANMFTVNRDEAQRLAKSRPHETDPAARRQRLQAAARKLLGLAQPAPLRVSPRSPARTSWHVLVEDLDLQPADGVHLPALFFSHVEVKQPRPALLWIDDAGRWAAFRHDGFLDAALDKFSPECPPNRPRILSLDVSGLGCLEPEPTAYDLAGWNDIQRILTYLSVANARPILGLQVRDALAALDYLRSRPEVDPQRLMIGGRGVGALVALHVALLDGKIHRVICSEMLSHYGALTEQFPYAWRPPIILPNVLSHYDLPEIPFAMPGTQVILINPCDAQQKPLSGEAADKLYAEAIAAGAVVKCGVNAGDAVRDAVQAAP